MYLKVLLMKEQTDYIQNIAEIRSLMERSSKFLSLSGLAGILAGTYALLGACIAYFYFEFNPTELFYSAPNLYQTMALAFGVLVLALISSILLSQKKAKEKNTRIWNSTSKSLLRSMAVPFFTGGIFIFVLISKELIGLIIPVMLIFYGLTLYNAGNYTIKEVRAMGLLQILLGLISTWVIQYSLIFWVIGFGVIHIIYGIYIRLRYER